jgi:hypothetical protein
MLIDDFQGAGFKVSEFQGFNVKSRGHAFDVGRKYAFVL